MKNKKKKVYLSVVIIVIIAIITGLILYKNSDAVKVREQLDLGKKYLSELEYDQAVAAYEAAIEIEPMNVDAYLGLADAYIGKSDYEAAALALQKGYELTQDETLKNKLDEVNLEIDRLRVVAEAAKLKEEEEKKEIFKSKEENKYSEVNLNFLDEFKFQGKPVADWEKEELISFFEVNCTDYFYDDYDVPFARYGMDNYNINEVEVTFHDDTTTSIFIYGDAEDSITIHDTEYSYSAAEGFDSEGELTKAEIALWESDIDISNLESFLGYFHPDLYHEYQELEERERITVGNAGRDCIRKVFTDKDSNLGSMVFEVADNTLYFEILYATESERIISIIINLGA